MRLVVGLLLPRISYRRLVDHHFAIAHDPFIVEGFGGHSARIKYSRAPAGLCRVRQEHKFIFPLVFKIQAFTCLAH